MAVDLGVQITDEGRSLYTGSFCPMMTSLSRCLEEAAFMVFKSTNIGVQNVGNVEYKNLTLIK